MRWSFVVLPLIHYPGWGDLSRFPTSAAPSVSLSAITTDDTHRGLAFYHVCFALATSVGHPSLRRSDQHAGEAYFKRARKLLGNPLDTVRFTLDDVPVLTLMGFYLIEMNRRDAAYVHVSRACARPTFQANTNVVLQLQGQSSNSHRHHSWRIQVVQRRSE
jgi:hypothetical protein